MPIRLRKVPRRFDLSNRGPVLFAVAWTGLLALALAADVSGLCHFKRLTGVPCPCCGGTRSAIALFAGDPWGAFLLNPLLFLLGGALLAIVALRLVFARRAEWDVSERGRRWARGLAIAALLGNWAYVIAYVG